MRKIYLLILLIFFGSFGYSQIHVEPFPTRNLGPLVHFFGVPTNNGGEIIQKNQFRFSNFLNVANNATSNQLEDEAIYLDGEMYRNDIQFRFGVGSGWQIGVSIPIVKHSGGVMDPFISGWHDTFGLPGKARETMADYNLTYMYRENNETVVMMNQKEMEIGDISFSISKSVINKNLHKLAVRSFVKVSSGKKDRLVGSGTNDYGVQLLGTIRPVSTQKKFSWFYSAGYLKVGDGALLDNQISKNVFFGNFGSAYYLNSKWIPKVQIDFHSRFYKKSIMKQLGKKSAQLIIGTDYFINRNLNLSASFSEDLIVNTAPDFVVQFGITYQL